MKRPKQKKGRSKHDRDKFVRVKCKLDCDDKKEGDGICSSDETDIGDCSDDSNSDETEVFYNSSESERSSKTRRKSGKKGFSLFVVAADPAACETDSDSSHRKTGKRDKKKRKTSDRADCESDMSDSSDRTAGKRDKKKRKSSDRADCESDMSDSSDRTAGKRDKKKRKTSDRVDCESDMSDSSDRTAGKRDKKKRKTVNDGCGGGSRKKSKDSKKRGSVKIKKMSSDSCEDLVDFSSPLKIIHRFICQGYDKSQMKGQKNKQLLAIRDCESLELDSEDYCEKGRFRRDKSKKTRRSSLPAKECKESRKESSSKKKRSLSYSNDTNGKRLSTKCCQTMSIDFSLTKNCKDSKNTRSKSCQTSKHDSAVYSLTEVRKRSPYILTSNQKPKQSACFVTPDQNHPGPGSTDCSEYFSLPAASQVNCTPNRPDTCRKDSRKPSRNRSVKTLELHVDLGSHNKQRHCSEEKESKPHSEENMKWFEKTFQDEFENFVKKCEETNSENPPKGGPSKKCKSKSKSKTKSSVEKEASIVLNAADLSKLANMMHQLSTEPNC
ncbi:hypothetical protein WDU94_007408 [Cyamophila willieti]